MFTFGVTLSLLAAKATFAFIADSNVTDACAQIASAISSASDVYYPLSVQYDEDIEHWAGSSTQEATCSVEPGTVDDVGKIIVGLTRTPFAVKGGGHATNVGFSSTTGVQVSMTRFNNITLSEDMATVDIGAGLTWDEVYDALDGTGMNVVGGRVTGVGVAGLTLGGGYSWKTSQYGLTIDNVAEFELVLPNGTVQSVTAENEDLWLALRGGMNNFGIVTNFKFNTVPQSDVWGGVITMTGDQFPAVSAAIANFSANNTDTKAAILPSYNSAAGLPGMLLILFYDDATQPGLFDAFMDIPAVTSDVKTRSFVDFVTSIPISLAPPVRGAFHTTSVLGYSPAILDLIVNMTLTYGPELALLDSAVLISIDVEPFASTLFTHGSDSAWPPSRSQALLPTNVYFSWVLPSADEMMWAVMEEIEGNVTALAVAEGQDVEHAAKYGNEALGDTTVEEIYGNNVVRLRSIREAVDPEDVMGLAGGFKF
ncbi:unnamed protein product [Peniophora sp. CBMAI 1063]|nr:unnamed protein product [Peniophora sp. CBMAI 1063]